MTETFPNKYFIDSIVKSYNAIGYPFNLLQKAYAYNDFLVPSSQTRTADLAVFGQEPLTYRSACFAHKIQLAGSDPSVLARELRALGAPQLFISGPTQTQIWSNRSDKVVFRETVVNESLPAYIFSKKNAWSPSDILRIKSGFQQPTPSQIDFVDIGLLPALEHEASSKIDHMIRSLLYKAEARTTRERTRMDPTDLFRAVFGLLTAKLFVDRNIIALNLASPEESLRFVSKHYGNGIGRIGVPSEILKELANEITTSLSFQNLSVDTLTYIYENTFVSTESRKRLGIHSTPSYVADYVLRQIPIELLPEADWNVFDPMCGHGIFLISAMRRIRELLPSQWDGPRRHQFFKKQIMGIEKDFFSVEVAKLCLTLADFPEKDGWDIQHADAFEGDHLSSRLKRTSIVVGNPPFENQEDFSPETSKAKLLLDRLFPSMKKGSFLGMILPASFLDGSDYRKQRKHLLDHYELLSVTKLPDGVFTYADSETCVIVGRRSDQRGRTNFSFVKKSELKDFQISLKPAILEQVAQEYFSVEQRSRLNVPILKELWDFLSDKGKLESIASFSIGVQYDKAIVKKKRDTVIRPSRFKGSRPGVTKVTSGFMEYHLQDHEFMSVEPSMRRRNAWNLDWRKPKVILPASRVSRGPWRLAAVIDRSGLLVHRNFYACWPKKATVSVESLAAILNSPVAQAYVFSHDYGRSTRAWTYRNIPIPNSFEKIVPILDALVKEYLINLKSDLEKARESLLQIDAYVLKQYELPPRMERKLLDLFWGEKRRVPFDFKGYIPPERSSWIPLHVFVSDPYQEGTLDHIMQGIPTFEDSRFIEYVKSLGRDDDVGS